jgi:hypothetical protein
MQTLKAALIALTVWAVPTSATALTVADVIALSRAGVSDVVLTALVDADRTIFALSTEQVLALRDAGVSDTVLLKMIASRKEFEPPLPPAIEASTPPVVEYRDSPLPNVTVSVPYFVPVPIFIDPRVTGHAPRHRTRRGDASRPLPPGTIRNGEFVERQ